VVDRTAKQSFEGHSTLFYYPSVTSMTSEKTTYEYLWNLANSRPRREGHRSRADAWNQFAPWHEATIPRSPSPFAADVFRRARMDWLAMSERSRIEAKRGYLALAASSFLDILKSYRIAEPQDVHGKIACDQ
jgi:hypothetical protein